MRRREFIAGSVAAAAMSLGGAHSFAQQSSSSITHVRRIGLLLFNSPQIDPISPFLENLKTLGYIEGKISSSIMLPRRVAPNVFPRWQLLWSIVNRT